MNASPSACAGWLAGAIRRIEAELSTGTNFVGRLALAGEMRAAGRQGSIQ